ncbi:hypothetical protein [Shumkonia mesophila]|uniref:hypothetical protein n=1 Tax=Shumkonia mesophila TaxID=2838854 RepID=UPI0029344331|nr:hypothetical protein [Shumkonia mesophila]
MDMKVVCEITIGGVTIIRHYTTAAGVNVGSVLRNIPGVGKPFWAWPTIPAGQVVGADFTGAPVVSSDPAANNAAIAAITALPEDVLIYDPPLQ